MLAFAPSFFKEEIKKQSCIGHHEIKEVTGTEDTQNL